MEKDFWLRRWDKDEIAFHRDAVHPYLPTFWPGLNLPSGSTVMVPLCGKSQDMIWLAKQGHKIIGIELSVKAINDFFSEQNIEPARRQQGAFTIFSHGPFEIWCGDIFALPENIWKQCAAVYDRASLVAFPLQMQTDYAKFLKRHVSNETPIFLITLDYRPGEIDGPPFNISRQQLHELFGDVFTIVEQDSRAALVDNPELEQRGLSRLQESLSFLTRR